MKALRLPSGRVVTLASYVAAWRALRLVDGSQRVGGWSPEGDTAGHVLRAMRAGLHQRINLHVPGHGVGRKWGSQWQRDAAHCARRVNTPRLIVRLHDVPQDLRARLAHRMAS